MKRCETVYPLIIQRKLTNCGDKTKGKSFQEALVEHQEIMLCFFLFSLRQKSYFKHIYI